MKTLFTTKINFNLDVDFDQAAENVTVLIDEDKLEIIKVVTKQELSQIDKKFIIGEFTTKTMKTRYIILNEDTQQIVHSYNLDTGKSNGVLVFADYETANSHAASRFNSWSIIKQEFKPLGLMKAWMSFELL